MRRKKKITVVITFFLFFGCFLFGSFLSLAQNTRTEDYTDSESRSEIKRYIRELKEINQLDSEKIQTGEHLIVSYYTTEFTE